MPPSLTHQGSPGHTVQPGPWSLSRAKHGARLVIMWAVGTLFDDPPCRLPGASSSRRWPTSREGRDTARRGAFILQSFKVDAALGKETHRRPTVTPLCLDKH